MPDHRKPSTENELLEAYKEMTLVELTEFVKQFEDTRNVTEADPVTPTTTGPAGAATQETGFDVIITQVGGDKKIGVIKEIRALTSLGLKEAKDLVERAPETVLKNVGITAAVNAKAQLELVGALVELDAHAPAHVLQHPGSALHDWQQDKTRPAQLETQIIRQLAAILGGAELAANALDVEAAMLSSWINGDSEPPDAVIRVARSIIEIGSVFRSIWDITLFEGWLMSSNAHLDYKRPMDLIAAGDADRVANAIESAAYGTYA